MVLAATLLLTACATAPGVAPGVAPGGKTATIARTANGVAHISAPDIETLAYATAYAHAQDNVCQTAGQLVTIRGERARYFGSSALGLLGRRMLPNSVSDTFIAAHMDDAKLARAWAATSADVQAMARGYVAGYNRFLSDNAQRMPAPCASQAWVQPMSLADFARLQELTMVQAGSAALADAVVGAQPPAPGAALPAGVTLADAAQALRDVGLLDSPLGSNAWAFGKDTTANASGLLLGNPHFPWDGVNRFWQMHLTVPGQLDVMGATIGHGAIVS
ncbi:MAG TPA: penicillin acylase family protein, partial [Ramlibacter sp.]|nr:penicillin acylase family protein [Ramlibacter sp.]